MADLTVIDARPVASDIIEKLEGVLEAAREGKLSSVAFAVVYRDGATGSGWSEAQSFSALSGSIAALQYDLMRKWREA